MKDAQGKRGNVWTLVVAALIVLLLLLYMVLFTVPAGTFAVVKTFGQITRKTDDPGLNIRAPWPFQSVQIIDKRLRMVDVQPAEVLSKDQNNLLVRLSVGWRVDDPIKFLNKLGNENSAMQTLVLRVSAARSTAIQETALDDIVNAGPGQAEKFDRFEQRILKLAQDGLAEADYGIKIDFLKVRALHFPKDVTATVQARMIAERKRESTRYRAEGENQAKIIRDDAMAKANQTLAAAEGEAIRIRGQGDAEAVKYYDVFNQNPDLMRLLMQIEAFRAIVKPGTTLALPADYQPFLGVLQPPPAPAAPAGQR